MGRSTLTAVRCGIDDRPGRQLPRLAPLGGGRAGRASRVVFLLGHARPAQPVPRRGRQGHTTSSSSERECRFCLVPALTSSDARPDPVAHSTAGERITTARRFDLTPPRIGRYRSDAGLAPGGRDPRGRVLDAGPGRSSAHGVAHITLATIVLACGLFAIALTLLTFTVQPLGAAADPVGWLSRANVANSPTPLAS